jgi:hypothetical protein
MPQESAKQEVIARFREIATEYAANTESINQLQARQSQLVAMAQDCHAAGRLFGFDVVAESASHQSSQNTQIGAPQIAISHKSIKEEILEVAENVYPGPVRASSLQKYLEQKRGEELHDKTIGMTLYRLSKKGLMKREGWDWFFVPPDQRGVFQ